MNILHLDSNHPYLTTQLETLGHSNIMDFQSDYKTIVDKIGDFEGVILRSRIPIDKEMITASAKLKFIARVGAGLENIDVEFANQKGIKVFSAKGGNANAVGEHTLGLLIGLTKNIMRSHLQITQNVWHREANRGIELEGKTIGIIGYGNTGQAFAKNLSGFDVEVLYHDIKEKPSTPFAKKASITDIQNQADVLSLHVPLTPKTYHMVNTPFINQFKKSIWLLNTSRGKCLDTIAITKALKNGSVLGLGLDVYEFETASFEGIKTESQEIKTAWDTLKKNENIVLTPHIAGWSVESKENMARIIVNQINNCF